MRPLVPAEIRASFVNCSQGKRGSLFSARRAGAAGRDGNTLGIYACGDLGCCQYVRARRKPSVPQPAETITTEDRITRLQHKVTRFVGQVIAA